VTYVLAGAENRPGASHATTPGFGPKPGTCNASALAMSPIILAVEDDPAIAQMLVDLLGFRGYRVEWARNASEARSRVASDPPDLILLDLKLPDVNGLVLCAELKARCDASIIICSATKRREDGVLGLELGADDFVTKPFDPAVLQARVGAVLRRRAGGRRPAPAAEDGDRRGGGLVLDRSRCRALLGGQPLSLTPSEYRLLAALADRPDAVVSREELAQTVWGQYDLSLGRSLDVHVGRLRAKLADADRSAPTIVTARGFGYRLVLGEAGTAD
jgi:DNA-binding response OmpR family regulator